SRNIGRQQRLRRHWEAICKWQLIPKGDPDPRGLTKSQFCILLGMILAAQEKSWLFHLAPFLIDLSA
ncbi:MAG: hypothetical protein NTY37_11795, partial [Methanothrix sp.]|nr:hypothetical protein [Methanothrix sp.]